MNRRACQATGLGVAKRWIQLSNWAQTYLLSLAFSLSFHRSDGLPRYSYFLGRAELYVSGGLEFYGCAFLTVLLSYCSHTLLFTHLKCLQWFLVHSQELCNHGAIVNFRMFLSPTRKNSYLLAITPHFLSPSTLCTSNYYSTFCIYEFYLFYTFLMSGIICSPLWLADIVLNLCCGHCPLESRKMCMLTDTDKSFGGGCRSWSPWIPI